MTKEVFEQIAEGLQEAIVLINSKPPRPALLDEMVAKNPDGWFIEEGNPNVIDPDGLGMEPLGKEFEDIWDKNTDVLYEN